LVVVWQKCQDNGIFVEFVFVLIPSFLNINEKRDFNGGRVGLPSKSRE